MKYLVVGLGNIGEEYQNTRHNIGFLVLDALAEASNISFTPDRLADKASFRFKGKTFILIKPSTYMNLSGKAVRYWLTQEKINIENLIVIVDDLALPFGSLRLKGKGSDGGHNGLKSIQEVLQTNIYARLRFGIGDEFSKGQQINYVLGEWSRRELENLEPRVDLACEIIKSFGTAGLNNTMNSYNNK